MVMVHWGREYYTVATERELSEARWLRAQGADIIIGHHQHVPLEHAVLGSGFAAYGVGNFLFDSHVCRAEDSIAWNWSSLACSRLPQGMREYVPDAVRESRIYRVRIQRRKSSPQASNRQGSLRILAEYLPCRIVSDPTRPVFQPEPVPGREWVEVCGPSDPHCRACSPDVPVQNS